MSLLRAKAGKRKFVLGRSSSVTEFADAKREYRRRLEIGLILSLLMAIAATRIATSLDTTEYFRMEDSIVFEYIDIPEIPPAIEEPPKIQMEEVLELPPEPEDEPQQEELVVEEEIEDLLGDNEERVELALNSNDVSSYLVSDSPIGTVVGSDLNVRNRSASQSDALKIKRGKYTGAEDGSGIDIGDGNRSNRRLVSDQGSVDLRVGHSKRPAARPRQAKKETSLGLNGKQERILSFASSTIGTEDYKLWNKIMSELDRLNKGRYQNVSKQLRRDRGGFTIGFDYSDGIAHEVNWRNNGNVWVKVIGSSTRTNLEELRRVLSSLLQLTLN